jgi:hypothetical protein
MKVVLVILQNRKGEGVDIADAIGRALRKSEPSHQRDIEMVCCVFREVIWSCGSCE